MICEQLEKRSDQKAFTGNPFGAFFASHVVANFLIYLYVCLRVGLTNFESSTSNPLTVKISHWLLLLAVVSVISLPVTSPFFALGYLSAVYLRIKRASYFVLGGILNGAFGAYVLAATPNLGFNETQESWATEPPFYDKFLNFAPACVVVGALAGLVAFAILRFTNRYPAGKEII